MRSPREMPWARVIDNGDSRSAARSSFTSTRTESLRNSPIDAANSVPFPLNTVIASPVRSRNTREM